VLAYPLVGALVWVTAVTNAASGFSAAPLVYVYAMIHLGTAKGWNRKFFCDMNSKRSPEMVGFLRIIARFWPRSPIETFLPQNRDLRHAQRKSLYSTSIPQQLATF